MCRVKIRSIRHLIRNRSNDILDEYITGIMYKSDSESYLEVPVAVVPTSPGHVLASSLGANDAISATYYAIRGILRSDTQIRFSY